MSELFLLYHSSPTSGAQSGDHYRWRHSGCSIQGLWHVESCASIGNFGLWPGGFVLCGLRGQRGASTGTFTKHEVNKKGRAQNHAKWALGFIVFSLPLHFGSGVYTVFILMVYYFVAFRSDFLSLPFQAIECSLAGVRPAGKKWCSDVDQ